MEQSGGVKNFGLKPLAVVGDARVEGLEDVPATKELGLDIPVTVWIGMFAPKGTATKIVARLASACEAASNDTEVREKLSNMDFGLKFRGLEEFTEFYEQEYEGNKALLKLIGLGQ
ncbi:tripartite tricarboxylate transporter substrate-binding protein [Paracoccus sp. Z330]|uniref:Tripartite tricarboxylate transporter substrate-binding protein n=1 Tax=Paracoccus onchidii TaxID=3017813 RepID=A0ABT4ZK48_9RHOB|nr:tripartite tricarboxylate transporter substrate-binding protein [Paracoccus onchidii]MDB6179740.1 tripartite tricarboxylate transporter substrate-binding protein [Paracoccus onchidii]